MILMLAVLTGIDGEAIFGGLILLALLALIITGKLRLEREVKEKDNIIVFKDKTIREQAETIKTLTLQAEITNTILKDLRNAAHISNHHNEH